MRSRALLSLQLFSHGDINVGEALMNTTCIQPFPFLTLTHADTNTHDVFSFSVHCFPFWLDEIRHGQLFRVFKSDIYTLTHGSVIRMDEIPYSLFSFPDYRSLYWDTNNHM